MQETYLTGPYKAAGYQTVELWALVKTHNTGPVELVHGFGITAELNETQNGVRFTISRPLLPRWWAPSLTVIGAGLLGSLTVVELTRIDHDEGAFYVSLPDADGVQLSVRVIGGRP